MIIKRNEILTSDTFNIDYLKLKNLSDSSHSEILSSLNNANLLYNNSSVIEDVILEDFLSLYTQAIDIDFANKGKDRVIESFLTTKLADSDFLLSNRLNIDTQNGNIILPIISTDTIPVMSIVMESDSNGDIGNSFSGGINSDLEVILNSASQEIFEYEKIVTSPDDTSLLLSIMFELEEAKVINGVYIKLFTTENGKYPKVNMVDISNNGVDWESIKTYSIIDGINKADCFLRFLPKETKYIRVRLIQDFFDSIKTSFGYRYRYLIGVREITFKQIEYGTKGEYVSVPFSTGRQINSSKFDYLDISNNDVKYFISGNNGGSWLPIQINGSTVSVSNINAGIFDGGEVRTLRTKIVMDKTNSILNKVVATEYLSLSPNNKYYLKEIPEEVELACGRHISFGREVRYECERQNVPTDSFLLRYVPYNLATILDEDQNRYMRVYVDDILQPVESWDILESTNPSNCEIKFTTIIQGAAQVTIDFAPVKYTPTVSNSSNIIKLPVEMFYDREEDIVVKEVDPENISRTLLPGEFSIKDRKTIQINNSTFNSTYKYFVSFLPSYKIKNSIQIDMNEIEVGAMYLYNRASLRIDYTYKSLYDVNLIKYYTPIGLEYRMEIE